MNGRTSQPVQAERERAIRSSDAFWMTPDELLSPQSSAESGDEFTPGAAEWDDDLSRRRFLEVMGASLSLAGVAALPGCISQPEEMVVPYDERPESVIPGQPLYFATAMPLAGFAKGILVKSEMGRPIKVEGNPDHPASLGATDVFGQAAVLDLYDPDRLQSVRRRGQIATWSEFLADLQPQLVRQQGRRGAGLRVQTESFTSPTLAAQLRGLLESFPEAKWHRHDPVASEHARRGAELAFGVEVNVVYHLERAGVVLALDADFLASGPAHLRDARHFVQGRREAAISGKIEGQLNRLYVVETTPTLTGSVADHRQPVPPHTVLALAREIAARLDVAVERPGRTELHPIPPKWIDVLLDDLKTSSEKAGGPPLVVAGEAQPPAVHALAHAINDKLGATGRTVSYTEPVEVVPAEARSLAELRDELRNGKVELLVILGGNPVFTAPADIDFSAALNAATDTFTAHLSDYVDETSAHVRWHIPAAHFLETWSDARAFDGTATIVQPLIAPLYQGKSAHELLAVLAGEARRSPHEIVRDHWRVWWSERNETSSNQQGGEPVLDGEFDRFWKQSLHDGVVAETAAFAKNVSLRDDFIDQFRSLAVSRQQAGQAAREQSATRGEFEIIFRPDPRAWDGRFANNAWLQELPRPHTNVTWDNPALISHQDAQRLGLDVGDVIELARGERRLQIPVYPVPGHPQGMITLHFGQGADRRGRVAAGVGFNTYRLRTTDAPWFDTGFTLRVTGENHSLAATQHHHRIDGRDLVDAITAEELQDAEEPALPPAREHDQSSFYPDWPRDRYEWGMSINTGTCIGCSACVIACQSENNIPVVGKRQVELGREMHWIRVDSWRRGPADNPETIHQPVPCMHCELAPCEPVCPVGATVHSDEGLNDMVYNRCVGTRYCSNNCPYKVRRFNFLDYNSELDDNPVLQLLKNPDVTVRSRGVMEKCTYCVQRINAARIEAEKRHVQGRGEGRIRDGEVVTACQAACPTEAIVFGNISDSESQVSRAKHSPLDYALLEHLNTRPRTTYLAAVRNPNGGMTNDQ